MANFVTSGVFGIFGGLVDQLSANETRVRNFGELVDQLFANETRVRNFGGLVDQLFAMRHACLLLCALLAACALEPSSFRVETEHVSHLTQHEPFTSHPTNDGYESLGLMACWKFPHAYLEVGERYSPERLDGMHEVFEARFGFDISLRR